MASRPGIRELLARLKYDPTLPAGRLRLEILQRGAEGDRELIEIGPEELQLGPAAFSTPSHPVVPYHRVLAIAYGELSWRRGMAAEAPALSVRDLAEALPAGSRALLRRLGVSLDPRAERQLSRYLDLLAVWSRAHNLVSRQLDASARAERVVESLAGLPLMGCRPLRLLDVGSGAGLPGLILAAACPALDVLLVEPRLKRAAFLRAALGELAMASARVAEARLEQLEPWRADVLTFRGLDWRPLARSAARQLHRGGLLLAYEASRARPDAPKGWRSVGRLEEQSLAVTAFERI